MSIDSCQVCGQYVDTDFYALYLGEVGWAVCEMCREEHLIDLEGVGEDDEAYKAWVSNGMIGLGIVTAQREYEIGIGI